MIAKWIGLPDDISEYQGFVYLLEYNDCFYIGKKNFWKALRRKPLKDKKRVRIDRVESNWRSYFGSSEKFLEFIGDEKDLVRREILYLCKTKWEMSYYELKEQLDRNVLFNDEYFNNIINVRLNGNGRPKTP